ncbi:YppE family protein [Halobacillus salinarum]|uniref:YppE family protein n=1 Tax=Halobacillus salinarum TaxID=2932257 RepID=A0ABY4ER51_9BACI|nr:DUF1798 family protein [Halobacillus salinarum]UOQ46460.1 YppE family protein [Halobacillus salinarum]
MLEENTQQLKQLIDRLHEQFINTTGPIDKKDHEFFERVKSETKPYFEWNQTWREQAEEFVKARDVRVHPNQIKSTHENIEMLILHSYYLDVQRKRYKELFQSAHYVLDMILADLNRMTD